MKMNARLKKIADALLDNDENDELIKEAYFAEDEFSPTDITVEIEGIGNIDFPLTEACIQSLKDISSKAKFGLREETLLDENVRNTNEIVPEKLRVTIEQSSLSRVLTKMRDLLGLSENSVLTSHLHNMLIYSRGQFFDMHQDTEKMDNMIATFVVVLPSSHIGGDLIIHQGDKKHVFSTENINETSIKCIGFYADCMHEILKVRHGHRVALTYNLVVDSIQSVPDELVNRKLKISVSNYFAGEESEEPQKLVYFFNHEYTEYGLRWNMLKGNDRKNAIALSKVAQSLSLVPHLALVKIQETFSTYGDYYDKNPEIAELEESKITLSYWLDSSNKKLPYDELNIGENEICWTQDTSDSFQPYKTEYEGYQGNYGGNKDFWYRRAAVVLWTKSSQTTMDFLLDNHNAIKNLLDLTSASGNKKEIVDIIQKAGKYLYEKCKDKEEGFIALANVALYLQDKDLASTLLSKFPRSVVSVSTAESLAKLQNEYGIAWCMSMINQLPKDSNNCFIDKIDYFMKIFVQSNGALQVAELLLEQQNVEKDEYVFNSYAGLGVNLPKRLEKLCQIFKACETVQNVSILHKIIEQVIASPKKYPFIKLVDLFLNLKVEVNPSFYVHFEPLKNFLVCSINDELALGEHSDNDWSIKAQMSCTCELCTEAMRFLNSKTEVRKRWPLREKLRNHVGNRLRGLSLPLNITVEATGSPHKLIIEKNKSMHQKAHDRYQELKCCQEKLHEHAF